MRMIAFLAIFILLVSGCTTQTKEALSMKITSPAFSDNGHIPVKFTCQGDDVNPQLDISGVPAGTKSLVLIMDDPDAPMGTWDHWIVFNMAPLTATIEENSVPAGAVQGRNSWGKSSWGGPCPPSGTHRYMFKLYALDTMLELGPGAVKSDVHKAMSGHVLAQAELTGLYAKG